MDRELRGILPIVYTPFDEAGDIDEEDLRQLVDHLIDSGAHGLAAVGMGSECLKLTREERERMAEVVIDQAGGRVPVIVGTSAENTRTAIDLSRHAERAGARAVFLTPPTSGPHGPATAGSHFRKVAQSMSIPVMIQHALIPITAQQMVELAQECKNISYVKEEAPGISGHMTTDILRLGQGRLQVFSGGSYLMDDLARGAVGAIPGSIGVADLSRAYDLFVAGDHAGARDAFDHFTPLSFWRQQFGLLATKEVLRRLGIFKVARLREPCNERLDEQDLRELTIIMERMGPPF